MMDEWINELTEQIRWLTDLIRDEEGALEIAYEHEMGDVQHVIDGIEDNIRIYRARKEALEQRIIFLRKSMELRERLVGDEDENGGNK